MGAIKEGHKMVPVPGCEGCGITIFLWQERIFQTLQQSHLNVVGSSGNPMHLILCTSKCYFAKVPGLESASKIQPLGLRKDSCSALHQPLDTTQGPFGLVTDVWSTEIFFSPLVRGQVQTGTCFSSRVGYKTEVWPDVAAYAGNPLEGKTRKPQIQGQPRLQQ